MINLTSYQATMVISDCQLRIANAMKEQTELEPQVKEYYNAYIALKERLDSTKKKISEDTNLLEFASEQLNHIKSGSGFKVLRSESHIDMKPREKKKYAKKKYTFGIWAVEVLKKTGCFMTTEQLWAAVVQEYDIPEGRERSKLRWTAINANWLKSDKIVCLQGKFGLPEWKDELSKYLRNAI